MDRSSDALRDFEAFEHVVQASRLGARARAKRDLSESLRTHALRLFLENGYDAVTVNAIAEAAGVTSRTFFRYFPTKETVVTDLMDGTNDRLASLLQIVDSSGTMFDVVRRAFHLWFEEYSALYETMRDLVQGSPDLSASMLHRSGEWEARLAEVFQRRFPEMSGLAATMWGSLTYLLTRFIGDFANERGTHVRDAVDPCLDEFIRQTSGVPAEASAPVTTNQH